jgi:hypothetical protein
MQQISLFVMRPRDEIKAGDSESMGAHIAGSDDTRGSELSCDLEFESNPSSIDEELASTHPNLLMSSQAHSEVERQSTEDSSAANTSEPSILVAAKNPHLVTSGEASTDSQPAGESDSLDFMRGGKSREFLNSLYPGMKSI